jgi:hypothetical protein
MSRSRTSARRPSTRFSMRTGEVLGMPNCQLRMVESHGGCWRCAAENSSALLTATIANPACTPLPTNQVLELQPLGYQQRLLHLPLHSGLRRVQVRPVSGESGPVFPVDVLVTMPVRRPSQQSCLCPAASASRYTGPAGSIGTSTNYITAAGSALKYGWTHEQCGSAYQGICQIPSYSFACPVRDPMLGQARCCSMQHSRSQEGAET